MELSNSDNNSRVDTTMATSRVATPPIIDLLAPMAENWCYTQVNYFICCNIYEFHNLVFLCNI